MKKLFFLVIVCMFVSGVGAISSDLKETYSPGETAIVKLAGNILEPIFLSQIKIKRVNQAIGFEGDVTKIGNGYYIWFIAPSNSGNYTLLIEDVHTTSGGLPTIEDFSQKFNVAVTQIDYSVNPGAIFETDNFEIVVNLYEDFDKVINVDFPEVREVILNPGINYIDFSVAEIIGTQTRTINIGHYALPAYIVGKGIAENASENDSNNPPSANCSDGKIDSNEICECGDDKECGNDDDNLAGKTCRSFGFDSGDLFCKDGCTNFDKNECVGEENYNPNTVTDCEISDNFCVSGIFDCRDAGGNVLPDDTYPCETWDKVCCTVDVAVELEMCSDLSGSVCGFDEECSGTSVEAADGTCCKGVCTASSTSNECEDNSGSCKTVCGNNEETKTYSCADSGKICCVSSGTTGTGETGGISWIWIMILIILILLVAVAIIFRDKLRVWWYKFRGNAKSQRIGPGGPPQAPMRMMPRPVPRFGFGGPTRFIGRGPTPGAIIRPTNTKDKEMEETMKKLKKMSE